VGYIEGNNFVLQDTDETGIAIVSLITRLRSIDYRRVQWEISGAQPGTELTLLWRTDYAPGQLNRIALESTPEGAQVELKPGEKLWIGHIEGLALAVRGKLAQPLVIKAVNTEPLDLRVTAYDRLHEWFAFQPWNGLSINTAAGGLPEQRVWLPCAVALIVLTALGLCLALQRALRWPAYPLVPLAAGAIVLAGWLLLDARWLWTRYAQARTTAASFAGKDMAARHLADLDRDLYTFVEEARAKLPASGARIYVFSDEIYFRTRTAYYLYPNNVFVERPHNNELPPATAQAKPGEYVLGYLRHGLQYDPAKKLLRWDGQAPRNADMLYAGRGGALFKVTP
jgi:hypothetical protein